MTDDRKKRDNSGGDSFDDFVSSAPKGETRSERRAREEREQREAKRAAKAEAKERRREKRQKPSPDEGELKRRSGRKKKIKITVTVIAAVLVLMFIGLVAAGYAVTNSGKNYPNVYIGDLPVGEMTREQTQTALEEHGWDELAAAELKVKLPAGVSFTADPCSAGVMLTKAQAVEAAYAHGRDGNLFSNLAAYLKSLVFSADVDGEDKPINDEYLRDKIFEGTAALAKKTSGGGYETDFDKGTLTLVKGAGQTELDEDALYGEIIKALGEGKTELEFSKLKTELKAPDFKKIYEELSAEPVNAYFTEKFEIVDGIPGCTFDVSAAEKQWQGAEIGEKLTIKLTMTEPEVTTESLKSLLYRDKLGGQTTYWGWSTEARKNNIKLAMEKINGTVLLPGEVFSYNDTVGKRTVEAGFGEASTYADGEVVEAIGGGICQVSSTLYCATMYAQMKTVSRTNHYFKVDYLDYGMDATVSWKTPDFKFSNSREYPVLVSAFCDDDNGAITVEIWGTDTDGSYVKLRHSSEEVFDEEWTETLIGHKVQTFRDIYDCNGVLMNTVSEPFGVYYFHDDKIDWPEEKLRQDAEKAAMEAAAEAGIPYFPTATATPTPAPESEDSFDEYS